MNFESTVFQPCREWIAEKVNQGQSWEAIQYMCTDAENAKEMLSVYIEEEGFPEDLELDEWIQFVEYYKSVYIPVIISDKADVIAIDNGNAANTYEVPSGITSSWENYVKFLVGKMDAGSISGVKKSCLWVLRHLREDTRTYGTVKGLVTGSVQSGKTANMCGLISMAADYNWNFFVVLSGTIDNLRKQTRDRFKKDLQNAEGVFWRVLDFTGEDKKFAAEELRLNALHGSKNYYYRYVTVCLKNKNRLEKLIDWIYDDPNRTSKLRVIVIDDEADQASINTAEITPEEEQERCAINQLIVNLVNGKKSDGSTPRIGVQAMNYISYTATPYANVLNESSVESLYPKDFICTLPESRDYFGARVIFGNNEEGCPGFDIIRDISKGDESQLKKVHRGEQLILPESAQSAIAWFLCACAVLRIAGHKKSISMLVHTTQIQKDHFVLYQVIKRLLSSKTKVIDLCARVYAREMLKVRKIDLQEANPEYSLLDNVKEYDYPFETIKCEIDNLLDGMSNIMMGEDKKPEYTNGLHICVDNCKANKEADEGTFLRVVYPTEEQLVEMEKAPVFLIIGGNTLSRGLTIDGLVCTYFARNVNQADTLMQMARWFGYRKGYELLQRIWMSLPVQDKFKSLAKIDMDMKREIELFMERGISPAQFGPRIRNTPEIAKFRITSKKKSQLAEYDDFDFCGDSYETTDFENDEFLSKNMELTLEFIKRVESITHYRHSTAAQALVWDSIDYKTIKNSFLSTYHISGFSSLESNLPIFCQWMEKMNEEGRFKFWNVALVNGDNKDDRWNIFYEENLGFIERTCKRDKLDKGQIDIGSLRSGRDAICDVNESEFSEKQKEDFAVVKKSGKDIIARRCEFNLEDKPLLLIYGIKRNGGMPRTSSRCAMNTMCDIVGISIIISGDSIGESHAKSIRIKIS